MKNIKQKIVIGVVSVLVVSLAALEIYSGVLQHREVPHDIKINGVFMSHAQEVKDFQLTSSKNKPFGKKDLQGHWTVMFFGFTDCAMVCPTTMAELNKMYKMLEKDLPPAQMPQVVMVSVDPDRDSVARMREYVTSYNPHFMGARADIIETVNFEKQLHISAAKVNTFDHGKNKYTMTHTADILLINPKGEVQAFLAYPQHAEEMAKDYKTVLRATEAVS